MSNKKPRTKVERTIDEKITFSKAQITIQKEKLRRNIEVLEEFEKGLRRLEAEKAYQPRKLPDLDDLLD